MEVPARPRESSGLPAIYIDSNHSDRFGASDRPAPFGIYGSSLAMSIPGSADRMDVPPPLPPPRFVNDPPYHGRDHHREPSSFGPREPSFYGSLSIDERPSYKRRESSSTVKPERDEGYSSGFSSLSSFSSTRSKHSLPSISAGFGQLHDHFQFQSSADAFTDMKKRLDPIKTFDSKSPPGQSLLSASANDAFPKRHPQENRYPPLSLPTALPFHTKSGLVLDSPDRYTQTPLHSAASPRSAPFHLNGHGDYRSPRSSDLNRSPPHRTRRTNSGSVPDDATVSTQGSYDAEDMEIDEPSSSSMKRLHIDEKSQGEYHTAGVKRRASSPPGDEPTLHNVPSQGDLLRRREPISRGSPTPRLSTIPQGSVSSVSSGRTGSYTSNLSLLTGSSITSMNSYGRRSPGCLSPGGISPITTDPGCHSPYSTPISLNTSPRGSLSRVPHQRNISESRPLASPRKLNEMGKPNGSKIQGFFMCDCCPKKPKKFETAEELSAHEAEKQYECSFCGNRFKNKNEAERHQNSLHVRRHSWSCSALSGYDRAFHDSTNRPGEADSCGYCGEEFPRSGRGPGASAPRHVSDQDWEERVRHLQEVHKFRECNSSKKFYRADHFRQHLKHSHAGTSGKWTNMLENACMLDEDPTPR